MHLSLQRISSLVRSLRFARTAKSSRRYRGRRSSYPRPTGNVSSSVLIFLRYIFVHCALIQRLPWIVILTLLYPQDAHRFQQLCSTTRAPTLHQVFPLLETITSRWEAKAKDPTYAIFHDALKAGIGKLTKYYLQLDNTPAYVLSHREFIRTALPVVRYTVLNIDLGSHPAILQAQLH